MRTLVVFILSLSFVSGGVITSFALELLIYPVIFTIWKWRSEVKPALARAQA